MSATNQNGIAPKSIVNRLRKFCGGQKPRRKSSSKSNRGRSNLQFEGLEKREMFSVSSISFASHSAEIRELNPSITGQTLVVKTDNASTGVHVSQVGSNIRIREVGTTHFLDFATSRFGAVEFQGGSGNDWFENRANVPVRAFGGAGNDYLVGGRLNDLLFGGENNDVLLGGEGKDRLWGSNGNDRLNGQAGSDTLRGGEGDDVLISIDAAYGEYVDSGSGADIMWIDRSGSSMDGVVGVTASDIVQEVASFANMTGPMFTGGKADLTLNGDNIADPTDSGQKVRFNNVVSAGNTQGSNPLFSSSGPHMTDIDQGSVGDCYFMAGLGGIAVSNPHTIRQNVVDFDDGTYGVRLGDSFYRVDNELPVSNQQSGATDSNLRYAGLGADNSMWVAIVEKAFAHYRRGANTYDSLNAGGINEANYAFRLNSIGNKWMQSYIDPAALANDIAERLADGQAMSIGIDSWTPPGGAPLIPKHNYTVASVIRNAAGEVTHITLRNPHGVDGGGNVDKADDGFINVTPRQLYTQLGHLGWGSV